MPIDKKAQNDWTPEELAVIAVCNEARAAEKDMQSDEYVKVFVNREGLLGAALSCDFTAGVTVMVRPGQTAPALWRKVLG